MLTLRLIGAALTTTCALALAQEKAPTVPVQMTITVEARQDHDKNIPILSGADVMVFQGKRRLPVRELIPCPAERTCLELFVLVDDASDVRLGSQLEDLRQFIEAQPAATSVGIGYMRNATVEVSQELTRDHRKAAAALRLPLGYSGVMPSPFLSLSDLIKRWPTSFARRAVLLVTSGTDPMGGELANPFLNCAIEDAQRSGIIVYATYMPTAGHSGHSFWQMYWGQNHLAQIAEETGGESYMLGFEPPISFAPYLAEISGHLAHQYVVTFLIEPGEKAGFQSVRLTTEVPNAEIVAASKVYVPARTQP